VDAVAVGVERIGEGQRFMTRVFADARAPQAAGQGPPAPAGGGAAPAPRGGPA
jgi:hypothetical protein